MLAFSSPLKSKLLMNCRMPTMELHKSQGRNLRANMNQSSTRYPFYILPTVPCTLLPLERNLFHVLLVLLEQNTPVWGPEQQLVRKQMIRCRKMNCLGTRLSSTTNWGRNRQDRLRRREFRRIALQPLPQLVSLRGCVLDTWRRHLLHAEW